MHTWHHGSEEAETEDPAAHWPAGRAKCVRDPGSQTNINNSNNDNKVSKKTPNIDL